MAVERNELTIIFGDQWDLEDFLTLLLESPIRKCVKLKWRGELWDAKTVHAKIIDPEDYIEDEDLDD